MPNEMNPQEIAKDMLERIDHPYSANLIALDETEIELLRHIANNEYEKVVHCKDCKFWLDDGFGKMCCARVGHTRKPDFYCANGKRKDDSHA